MLPQDEDTGTNCAPFRLVGEQVQVAPLWAEMSLYIHGTQ